jgi:hypothetical protein
LKNDHSLQRAPPVVFMCESLLWVYVRSRSNKNLLYCFPPLCTIIFVPLINWKYHRNFLRLDFFPLNGIKEWREVGTSSGSQSDCYVNTRKFYECYTWNHPFASRERTLFNFHLSTKEKHCALAMCNIHTHNRKSYNCWVFESCQDLA